MINITPSAMASLLFRPKFMNAADNGLVLPTLSLERNPSQPGFPSPFSHISLQCQLCLDLTAAMDGVKNEIIPLRVVVKLRDTVGKWLRDLPPVYALMDPVTKWDAANSWIVFQRRYLHMFGYMSVFHPLKPYLTMDSSQPIDGDEMKLREAGVAAALKLMVVAEKFYQHLYPTAPRFHYAVFCIFDTATVLYSAFIHDKARNLPQRDRLLQLVKKSLEMLEELNTLSGTTTILSKTLRSWIGNLMFDDPEATAAKRRKVTETGSQGSSGTDAGSSHSGSGSGSPDDSHGSLASSPPESSYEQAMASLGSSHDMLPKMVEVVDPSQFVLPNIFTAEHALWPPPARRGLPVFDAMPHFPDAWPTNSHLNPILTVPPTYQLNTAVGQGFGANFPVPSHPTFHAAAGRFDSYVQTFPNELLNAIPDGGYLATHENTPVGFAGSQAQAQALALDFHPTSWSSDSPAGIGNFHGETPFWADHGVFGGEQRLNPEPGTSISANLSGSVDLNDRDSQGLLAVWNYSVLNLNINSNSGPSSQ